MSKFALIALAVYLFLVGLFSVTNIQVEWGRPIMGFSALIAGVLIGIWAISGWRSPGP